MSHWYTVFCKARGEEVAEANLRNQNYAVYLPRLLTRKRRAGKWIDAVEPLFPRYLFVRPRDTSHSLAPVRSTLGVSNIVCFGAMPATVSEALIQELKGRQDPAVGMHVCSAPLAPGCPVKFVDGPLVGLDGIFSKEAGVERVIVLFELLGKQNRMSVSRDWLVAAA